MVESLSRGGDRSQMKSRAIIHDLYGIWGDRVLTISQFPRIATVQFELKKRRFSLVLKNPEPYIAVAQVCDGECCGIRIIHRNIEGPNCLEFARYRVELWTEDDQIVSFVVDEFGLSG